MGMSEQIHISIGMGMSYTNSRTDYISANTNRVNNFGQDVEATHYVRQWSLVLPSRILVGSLRHKGIFGLDITKPLSIQIEEVATVETSLDTSIPGMGDPMGTLMTQRNNFETEDLPHLDGWMWRLTWGYEYSLSSKWRISTQIRYLLTQQKPQLSLVDPPLLPGYLPRRFDVGLRVDYVF